MLDDWKFNSTDGLSVPFWFGVVIVLLLIFLLAWSIYGWVKVSEGLSSRNRLLRHINSGGSQRFQAELSDYSQPQPHVARHAGYGQFGTSAHAGRGYAHGSGVRSRRVGRGRERFATARAGPESGLDVNARTEMYLASQAFGSDGKPLTMAAEDDWAVGTGRDYDYSHYSDQSTGVPLIAGAAYPKTDSSHMTEAQLVGQIHA